MKKILQTTNVINIALITVLLAAVQSTAAQASEYPKNPVLRPLTLTSGTVELSGGYVYGKQHDKDTEVALGGNIAYGFTDDFQLASDGITYSLFKNKSAGFELATQAGFRGYFEDKQGDTLGLGASVLAKQIISDNLAFTFAAGYSHWDIDNIDNRYEFDYAVGLITNLSENITFSAQYTYRDLKGFTQEQANITTIGLNYTLTKDFDIGTTFTYSDYIETNNGFALLETPEKMIGIYANWRF
jgi:opacity protein-like surface antigen